MALNFPATPTLNQTYSFGAYTWQWDGGSWVGAVPIVNATINNTTIGAATPSTAVFTTLATTGVTTLGTYASVYELLENATISASAPTSTTNFDVVTQAVQYYTSNTTTNFTLNIRGNSTTTLNTMLTTGQSATFALMVTNGSTAYYPNAVTIDGTSVTPKWGGGTAPSAGNASAIDVYVYTVIKTASATYTVLANQTKYA